MKQSKIEPRFSEALQGASVCNCYLESGFSGKGQTRLRGRKDLENSGMGEWDECLAVHESGKTKNIYMITRSAEFLSLRILRNGTCVEVKKFEKRHREGIGANFAEMRFLRNGYMSDYFEGNYGVLFCVAGDLWVLDDLDPLNAGKIKNIRVPSSDIDGALTLSSVCVVANRIIVSVADTATWYYSSIGGLQQEEIYDEEKEAVTQARIEVNRPGKKVL